MHKLVSPKQFQYYFSQFNLSINNSPCQNPKKVQFNIRSKSSGDADFDLMESQKSQISRRQSSAEVMKGKMFDMLFLGRNYISPTTDFEELSITSLEQKVGNLPGERFLVKADIEAFRSDPRG